MEAEERPVKLRKLENGSEEFCASDSMPATGRNSTGEHHNNISSVDIQHDSINNAPSRADHQEKQSSVDHTANASVIPSAVVSDADTQLPEVDAPKPTSKNQLKKLKRQQEWEAGRGERKAKRKEQAKQKKERKRAAKQADIANGVAPAIPKAKDLQKAVQLPITFIFDCGFDDMMMDKEMKSLASQLTRCYSDNKNARFRAHLAISSFGGKLKERYDVVFAKHYESWKGVRFFFEDFVEVSEKAKAWMQAENGGELAGVFQKDAETQDEASSKSEEQGEVIYLSSESDVTLDELKPYSTYIIGGLVDRNRHKGICYKRAMERGVKTAKLPIGQFLEMNSRAVLATNHVNEIMLKWLECGNWGDAFMQVIPKRKGGVLRNGSESGGNGESGVDGLDSSALAVADGDADEEMAPEEEQGVSLAKEPTEDRNS